MFNLAGGEFLRQVEVDFQKWLLLMHWWAFEIAVTTAAAQLEVAENTACGVYQWLREVCSTKLISTPILLGGPGKEVQIDESLFTHKPKVKNYIFKITSTMLIKN